MKPSSRKRLARLAERPAAERSMQEHGTLEGRLQNICEVLNATKNAEHGRALASLVEQWKQAKSLNDMLRANPMLGSDLRSGAEIAYFEGSKKGKYGRYVVSPPAPLEPHEAYPEAFAIWVFANLVTNPLCEDLAGPCSRCGDYYIKKRADQKKYCSTICGHRAEAQKALEDERDNRLRRARELIRQWDHLPSRPDVDWRDWVSATDRSISKNWLTRATRPGGYGLKPPRKGAKNATHKG